MPTAKDDVGEFYDSGFRTALFGPAHLAARLNGGAATASTAPIDASGRSCGGGSSGASSSG